MTLSHLQQWLLSYCPQHQDVNKQFLWKDGIVYAEALKQIYHEGFQSLRQVMFCAESFKMITHCQASLLESSLSYCWDEQQDDNVSRLLGSNCNKTTTNIV